MFIRIALSIRWVKVQRLDQYLEHHVLYECWLLLLLLLLLLIILPLLPLFLLLPLLLLLFLQLRLLLSHLLSLVLFLLLLLLLKQWLLLPSIAHTYMKCYTHGMVSITHIPSVKIRVKEDNTMADACILQDSGSPLSGSVKSEWPVGSIRQLLRFCECSGCWLHGCQNSSTGTFMT